MRIIDLAIKDLSQIFRDIRSALFLVAMPIVFTLFMGFAYQSGGDGDASTDYRIPLGWVNNDPGSELSEALFEMISNLSVLSIVELTPETMDEALRNNEVAGVMIIPTSYTKKVQEAVLRGVIDENPLQLMLLTDPSTPEGQSLFQSLRAPVMKTLSSVEIAVLSSESVGRSDDPGEFNRAFQAAIQAWSATDNNALVKVEMAVAEPEQAWYGDNPYNQASPGILVQFAIFGLVTSGQIFLQERKSRTLQRMMTTSLRPWQIIAGHMLAMFVIVFIQEALLVVFGQLALGVNYLRAPLGILLVTVALGLWVAAMGLLIGVLAKDDSQVVLFSMLAMFLFSALGGTWFPLEASSGAFAMIARTMPSAWAMNGLQNILIRGLDSSSAWLPSAVVLVYAVVFFLVALWRFRKLEI